MSGSSGRRWSGFSLLSQPGVPKDIMERVAKRMTLEELKAFQKAYRQKAVSWHPRSLSWLGQGLRERLSKTLSLRFSRQRFPE